MARSKRRVNKRVRSGENGTPQISRDRQPTTNPLQSTSENAISQQTPTAAEHDLFNQRLSIGHRHDVARQIAQQHGNRYLQRLIEDNNPRHIQRLYGTGIGEALLGAVFEEEMPVEQIIASNDPFNVNPTTVPAIKAASLDDRKKCITLKLRETWGLTARDVYQILKPIWSTFTEAELEESVDLWKETNKFALMHGTWYADLPFYERRADQFKGDTQDLATGRLDRNLHETIYKKIELGIFYEEGEEREFKANPQEEADNLEEMQKDAEVLSKAFMARTMLDNLQVGWRPMTYGEQQIDALDQSVDYLGDVYDVAIGQSTEIPLPEFKPPPQYAPVHFKEGKPPIGPTGEEFIPMPSYDQVQEQYLKVLQLIEGLNLKHPGLFALSNNDGLDSFASADPAKARQIIKEVLDELSLNIIKASMTIESNDLDYRELKPLHQQMKRGDVQSERGVDWTSPLNQWVIENEVEDYEDAEFWKSIGLASLAAAGFLIAEFATAGTATFWLGAAAGSLAGGYQAYSSIEHYLDVAQVHSAALSEGSALVSEGQVSAALMSAILDTVFAFVDIASPAAKFLRAKSLSDLTAIKGVENFEDLKGYGKNLFGPAKGFMNVMEVNKGISKAGKAFSGELAQDLRIIRHGDPGSAETIARGVQEFGVGKTADFVFGWTDEIPAIEKSNMLLAMVDPGSPAAQRITRYMNSIPLTPVELQGHLRNLAKFDDMISSGAMTAAEADRIILGLIDEVGPLEVIKRAGGWKKLNNPVVLNAESRAGKTLDEWRRGLVSEVDEYMEKNFRGSIQDTGTKKSTSDLDTSQLGEDATGLKAAAHREAAVSYVSGRLDMKPQELAKLLDTDFFVDPRRSHIYEHVFKGMPEVRQEIAEKAAQFEQELIQNYRLFAARSNGNIPLAKQIQEQMQALGIREMPYKPLTPENIAYLNRNIDYLMDELAQVVKRTDLTEAEILARQKELVTEISQKQALIDAAEVGGYYSGAGVRQFVSERDAFAGYSPFIDPKTREVLGEGAANPMTHGSILAGSIDQLAKLDPAVTKLMKELDPISGKLLGKITDETKFAKCLKDIGKYGERFMDFVRRANLEGYSDELVDTFRDRFNAILVASKEADTTAKLERLAMDAKGALDELDAMHMDILKKMREGTGGFDLQSIDEVASMAKAQARLMQAKDHAMYLLALAMQPTGKEAAKAGASADADDE